MIQDPASLQQPDDVASERHRPLVPTDDGWPVHRASKAGDDDGRPRRPTRAAMRSLRSSRANTPIAAPSTTSPTSAARTIAEPAPPLRASRARATIGRPSLTKLFQIPDTTMASAVCGTGIPHERCIVNVTPMPSAPPPGTVLATAVEPRLATAASPTRRPGSTAISIGQ